ncbi:hypothetical protein [Microtetraspora sp. AC03309]|uniref:hypothetical protein n=1 Tax=Microtetraspora sp. AC03309 TaxID=2779376 RepID=UPI001E338EBF|nr:hypothetical protein [Microtetraspora sp. AC03309]
MPMAQAMPIPQVWVPQVLMLQVPVPQVLMLRVPIPQVLMVAAARVILRVRAAVRNRSTPRPRSWRAAFLPEGRATACPIRSVPAAPGAIPC